ncbi:hypothetical protein C8R43DRAFT_1110382 [Mycena crocata]|nr:hypothetical protein C8R43DRAFT_1110382 [Mycena crocata]
MASLRMGASADQYLQKTSELDGGSAGRYENGITRKWTWVRGDKDITAASKSDGQRNVAGALRNGSHISSLSVSGNLICERIVVDETDMRAPAEKRRSESIYMNALGTSEAENESVLRRQGFVVDSALIPNREHGLMAVFRRERCSLDTPARREQVNEGSSRCKNGAPVDGIRQMDAGVKKGGTAYWIGKYKRTQEYAPVLVLQKKSLVVMGEKERTCFEWTADQAAGNKGRAGEGMSRSGGARIAGPVGVG